MNIEANLKKLKTSIKRRKKITLTLMLGFLMTGVIGYANDISVYIDAKNEKVLTEVEYNKLNEDEKKKYNKVIIDKNNNVYTIKIDNALHYFSVNSNEKDKESNYENDAAKGENAIAIGPKALSVSKKSVAIGYNAKIEGNGGNDEGGGSVAIGENSLITTNGLDFPSIAIGKNSKVLNGSGKQEGVLSFGNSKYAGGIVLGENSYARTGSIQIGSHTYSGLMGGINVNNATNEEANIVNMTTIGTNSYQKGAMGTMVGAYNISTGNFTGEGGGNSLAYGSQNFGSSVFGTLNSIKSEPEKIEFMELFGHKLPLGTGTSGVANSIVGIANTTEKSNGSLIFGAGNVITNSNEELKLTDTVTGSFKNVDEAVKKFQTVIKESKAGGATLAIGGGNTADYTKQVTMIGTNNTVKGDKDKKVELNMVAGDDNKIENSSHNIVYGNKFRVGVAKQTRDNEPTPDVNGNLLFGFNTKENVVNNKNVVALGNDIKVGTDNSVYLGTNSTEAKEVNTLWRSKKDDIDKAYKEYAGFDHIGGIVTVGNDTLTRVIQNVAPGLISATSTDAINGSQLYNYVAKQYITVKDGNGNSTQVKLGDTLTLKGTTVDVKVEKPKQAQPTPVAPTPATPVTPAPAAPTETKAPEHTATFETKGNVGGSDTFGYKYRDDKGKETELTEGPDGKLYTNEFIQNNEYKNNKWVKKGTDTASEKVSDNQYEKNNEKVILSTKYGKIITDVADGVKDNDAVNLSQLKTVSTKVEKNTSDIQQLQKDVKEVDKKSDLALGGVANAVAIANLVQVNSYSDYRHNLSAAYGYYGGSHALAIGFSGVTKDRRLVYKLSGSVNNKGNLAFGVGAGVMLGNKEESMEHKDINVKELYEKISKLEKENSEFREMFKKIGVMK